MTELKWEEPPRKRTAAPKGKHAAIAAQLKERPGEWAVIDAFDTAQHAGQMAWQVKDAGRLKAYAPGGSFEAVARKVDGEYRLYARYVGGAGA